MKYTGIENNNITINEDSKVSGMINGSVTVLEGFDLKVSGCVNGNIYLAKNSKLKVSGMVSGNVYKADDSVKVKISGMVTGKVYIDNNIEINNETNHKEEHTSASFVNSNIEFDNSKYIFNESSVTNVSGILGIPITKNKSNINISGKSGISIIGNKKVRINSNSGTIISTSNGKTTVNGIDLDTLTPDEDGIYTIE